VTFLAAVTGHPILPYHIEAARHWTLRSWDRTQIPKPFSRVALVIGPPMQVASSSEDALAAGARDLAEALTILEHRARSLVEQ
jgi:lysophospholipid acyltransferase (LPLAT)-like uncharacterized protein